MIDLIIQIADGNSGIVETGSRMAAAIRDHSHSTQSLVQEWIRSESTMTVAESALYWVRGHMLYTPDPPGWDRYLTPDAHLAVIQSQGVSLGDCDDYVVLFGGLCWQAGIPQRLVLVSYRSDHELTHVYQRLYIEREWMPVDPITPWPIGIKADAPTYTVEVPV